ncbi:hypothetical protein [Maribacter sp. LLG6340-A2]|uniref:hypothetical protein n=1 Tax=Maribacter sp. LLG6340-A2 TaxID=3160834 RepID=UPI003870E982
MKQDSEKTKFVKEPEEDTREYILQKNKKTKLGATIVIAFLVLLIIGIIVSNVFFTN